MRVLFFGMEGLFSRAPLAALLEADFEVCAVVVPRPARVTNDSAAVRTVPPPQRRPHALPIVATALEPTIVGLAWVQGLPVLEVGRLSHPETLAAVRDLRPDV